MLSSSQLKSLDFFLKKKKRARSKKLPTHEIRQLRRTEQSPGQHNLPKLTQKKSNISQTCRYKRNVIHIEQERLCLRLLSHGHSTAPPAPGVRVPHQALLWHQLASPSSDAQDPPLSHERILAPEMYPHSCEQVILRKTSEQLDGKPSSSCLAVRQELDVHM